MRMTHNSLATNFKSTFLSCEKDQEAIWRKLFIDNKRYAEKLKRLLVINNSDCLDETQHQYKHIIDEMDMAKLREDGYIRVIPKLSFGEHEEVKSYIILEFDDFMPTTNPEFRDCTISFTIISHLDYWDLEDYRLRPHQIAGYVDGILDGAKLSGIGTLQFLGASQVVLNEYLGGIILRYIATHGGEDKSSEGANDIKEQD